MSSNDQPSSNDRPSSNDSSNGQPADLATPDVVRRQGAKPRLPPAAERPGPVPPRRRPRGPRQNATLEAFRDTLSKLRGRRPRSERQTPLVPQASISGRALVIVIVIMTFLASVTAGAVELIATASSGWSDDVTREMTIQVRPRSGRSIDSDVEQAAGIARAADGIAAARIYTKAESEHLLEPWLGSSFPLDQMPVPRLIIVTLAEKNGTKASPDLAALKRLLTASVPTATLDDHRQWSARLATMANALVLVGLFVLGLVLIATALAIAFATRGAMAGTREIINVLHLVGAEDRFIADEFQRHFMLVGLRGGILGSGLAILAFLLASLFSAHLSATPQGDEIEALFGTFGLGLRGYGAMILIAAIVSGITAIVTRATVYRNLRGLD